MFGTVQYGVHINGYFNHPQKGMFVWVAKRSPLKPTWPGKLDQMASVLHLLFISVQRVAVRNLDILYYYSINFSRADSRKISIIIARNKLAAKFHFLSQRHCKIYKTKLSP